MQQPWRQPLYKLVPAQTGGDCPFPRPKEISFGMRAAVIAAAPIFIDPNISNGSTPIPPYFDLLHLLYMDG
jgi:hypothetical protein